MLWPLCAVGVAFLVAAATTWPDLTKARASEKIVALNRMCIAIPLAIFGAEHLGAAKFLTDAGAGLDSVASLLGLLRRSGVTRCLPEHRDASV